MIIVLSNIFRKKGLRSDRSPDFFTPPPIRHSVPVLCADRLQRFRSSQNATALDAATFSESTPFFIGILTM